MTACVLKVETRSLLGERPWVRDPKTTTAVVSGGGDLRFESDK